MINFERFTLDNGLRVVFHRDTTTPMTVVNTLYDVGARDEHPERTGFAHLFEHLMFGGSVNIPNFDTPLQNAGGNNNAFTNNDITNYYDVLPTQNIETALWLESDRMLSLAFTPKSLEVQRNVVIEEFNQRYLNQPYGDIWLQFRPLAYKKHPYQWATIGKNIDHIKEASMAEVKGFFQRHYHPGNAILSIGGNLELNRVKELVQKWFGDIPKKEKMIRSIPKEPLQTEYRTATITREVPSDMVLFGFKIPGYLQKGYFASDLIADILGGGKSSRLHKILKKKNELVTDIGAFTTDSFDTGLLMIVAHPEDNVLINELEEAIFKVIEEIKEEIIPQHELQKFINKTKTVLEFEYQELTNRCFELAQFELLGDANIINTQTDQYDAITPKILQDTARKVLNRTNCSKLVIQRK